ncbi:hypothetical protein PWT90_06843 [Aphanocladium album]|nr:hypothetical protein PWT90_06843 [Aphanocladium album]
MQFSVAILAVAGLVAAQDLKNAIPECAKTCVGKFLTGSDIAGCSPIDYGCVCGNKDFINSIACCIAPVCDDKGKADTIALANRVCKAFNVDLPTAVTCNTAAPTSTGSGSGSGSSSGSAASTPTATTDKTSESAGAKTTGTSSGPAATSSGASGSGASSSAATTTSKPNAAPTNVAGLVGAAAALAFAL